MSDSDRARVLLNIAIETSGSCHNKMMEVKNGWKIRGIYGDPAPQFLPEELCNVIGMPLEEGDIIRCETNRSHKFSISKFIKINSENGIWGSRVYLCQEIGGEGLCNISNESISILRFMPKTLLYTGKENQIYNFAKKAFLGRYNKNSDYMKRCGGVDITGNTLTIWSRPHIWAQTKKIKGKEMYAHPKKFVMEWDKNTRLKDIVNYLNQNGFSKEYEYKEYEPVEGMRGCIRITKNSLNKVLEDTL